MDRTILHVNVVNFYVAVAQALNPRLSSYPVAVASAGASRRVVIDHSPLARTAGIYKGMLLDVAQRKCPDLIILSPTPELYDRAQTALMDHASKLSPRVEPAGPGHLFIDLSGTRRLWGDPADTADSFRKALKDQTSLSCTVGLAANKLVSKVATRVVKPIGLCKIIHGCEDEFLAPLPVNLLPGIDFKVILKLIQFNINIINDLHAISVRALSDALGESAFELHQLSHGIDETPVRESVASAPHIRESLVFDGQTNDDRVIESGLFKLVMQGGFKIRRMGLAARKIRVCITYADGTRAQRSTALHLPLSGDLSLHEAAVHLLRKALLRRVRLTSIALDLQELTFPYGQLDLFINDENETNLMSALDKIRGDFGPHAIGFWGRVRGE